MERHWKVWWNGLDPNNEDHRSAKYPYRQSFLKLIKTVAVDETDDGDELPRDMDLSQFGKYHALSKENLIDLNKL